MKITKFLSKLTVASILCVLGLLVANTSAHASIWVLAGEPKMPESLILKQK